MKKIKYLLFGLLAMLIGVNTVNAANAVIKVNKTSVTVGDSFTASVIVTDAASWKISVTTTGPVSSDCASKLTEADVSSNGMNTNRTISATCKATGTGTITFTLTNSHVVKYISLEEQEKRPVSGSTSVFVNPVTTKTTTTTTTTTTTSTTTTSTTTKKQKQDQTLSQSTTTTQPIEITTEPVTEPVSVLPKAQLNSIKIVGYNVEFDPENNIIKFKVLEGVNEIYIATTQGEGINVSGIGIVDISNKDSIELELSGEGYETSKYTIVIDRYSDKVEEKKSYNNILLIISLFVSIIIIIVLLIKGDYFKFKH